ncbi:melanocortin-2 receptor accessory protein 2A-like isoform X2 [Festucalex cinctus]
MVRRLALNVLVVALSNPGCGHTCFQARNKTDSIVIGFWVGLAVFVIFMFFVLTLRTKTGAPQQENPDADNLPGPGNGLLNIIGPKDDEDSDDIAVSRPFMAESRSYFNFYISEDEEGKRWKKQNGRQGNFKESGGTTPVMIEDGDRGERLPLNGLAVDERKTDTECDFLSHFNIPNFVTSSLGEDDLLCEPPITLDQNIRSMW